MFHYWAATARRNLLCDNNAAAEAAEAALAISSYRHFLAGAAPEGRKVCRALYEVAFLQMRIAQLEALPPTGVVAIALCSNSPAEKNAELVVASCSCFV